MVHVAGKVKQQAGSNNENERGRFIGHIMRHNQQDLMTGAHMFRGLKLEMM